MPKIPSENQRARKKTTFLDAIYNEIHYGAYLFLTTLRSYLSKMRETQLSDWIPSPQIPSTRLVRWLFKWNYKTHLIGACRFPLHFCFDQLATHNPSHTQNPYIFISYYLTDTLQEWLKSGMRYVPDFSHSGIFWFRKKAWGEECSLKWRNKYIAVLHCHHYQRFCNNNVLNVQIRNILNTKH